MDKFAPGDKEYLSRRKEFAQSIGQPDLFSLVDQFGLYAGVNTIGTKLAVYEIIKQVINVPGNFVEFGSWKGGNLLFMAKVLQLLQPNTIKRVFSFDSFEGLQVFDEKDGLNPDEWTGEYTGNEAMIRKAIDLYDMNEWVHIVKGDAMETIDAFEKEHPYMMFSLAYVDFDLYKPVKRALEYIAPRLSTGGAIVFDEALSPLWPGEGLAMLEFLQDKSNGHFKMFNVEFARQPTCYLIKQ